MSLGGLITFVSYVAMLFMPIISISNIFSQINNAIVSVDRLDEIMKQNPVVRDDTNSKPIVEFRN